MTTYNLAVYSALYGPIAIENVIEPKIVEAVKDYKNHVGLTTSLF